MREIKFKAWDKSKKHWLDTEGTTLHDIVTGMIKAGATLGNGNHLNWERDIIFVQYTGLHDKQGKEIYENDIISKAGAYVIWDDKLGCWAFTFKGDKMSYPLFYENNIEKAEVIGNIYENPKLVEG